MKGLFSRFSPSFPKTLVYMLQLGEYREKEYLSWLARVKRFDQVKKRGSLKYTMPAKLLLTYLLLGIFGQLATASALVGYGAGSRSVLLMLVGTMAVVSYPWVWSYLLVLPLGVGKFLIIGPKNKKLTASAKQIFRDHKGVKIAVAGSYGKTSMKEMLSIVMSEGKKVASTSGNMNVDVSIAKFAQKLEGDEDVVIVEFGEGEPGDIGKFSDLVKPGIAVITGIAPAHLDKYPSLESAAEDIFSLNQVVSDKNIYANKDSIEARPYITNSMRAYGLDGLDGWKTGKVKVDFDGTSFVLTKSEEKLSLHSGLLGEHQVGPMIAVAVLATEIGLTDKQIEAGFKKVQPYDHRMEPRNIEGAWVIDDTYNGNIDGMKAGLNLLKSLPGKRKIYVTPGLVDQGEEVEKVHRELGVAIAKSKVDKVVLMNNSVTDLIKAGLDEGSFAGEVQIEEDPLDFYTNLTHHLANGDVVLMQNDWPDQYN